MNTHKFELGNKVRFTSHNSDIVEGIITDRDINMMSWNPNYNVTRADGMCYIGVAESKLELIEEGDHRSDDEKKAYTLYKSLQELGFA